MCFVAVERQMHNAELLISMFIWIHDQIIHFVVRELIFCVNIFLEEIINNSKTNDYDD